MPGYVVDTLEYHAPGGAGGYADDLRIDEVCDANEASAQRRRYGHAVDKPEIVQPRGFTDKPDQRQQETQTTPVTRQSSLPDLEDFQGVAQVELGIVEQAVGQAGADDDAKHHIWEQTLQFTGCATLPNVDALHDLEPEQKHRGKQKAVPVNSENSKGKQDRVGVPVDQGGSTPDGSECAIITKQSSFDLSG